MRAGGVCVLKCTRETLTAGLAENEYLQDFYKDMTKEAFPMQVYICL